jgi:hypothetical protein
MINFQLELSAGRPWQFYLFVELPSAVTLPEDTAPDAHGRRRWLCPSGGLDTQLMAAIISPAGSQTLVVRPVASTCTE